MGVFAQGHDALPPYPRGGGRQAAGCRLRENFIERIFVMQRWYDLQAGRRSLKGILDFHATHKYLLMAHCPKTLKELGALLARGKELSAGDLHETYFTEFIHALKKIATVKKNTNVLMHIMGYFKKDLDTDKRRAERR